MGTNWISQNHRPLISYGAWTNLSSSRPSSLFSRLMGIRSASSRVFDPSFADFPGLDDKESKELSGSDDIEFHCTQKKIAPATLRPSKPPASRHALTVASTTLWIYTLNHRRTVFALLGVVGPTVIAYTFMFNLVNWGQSSFLHGLVGYVFGLRTAALLFLLTILGACSIIERSAIKWIPSNLPHSLRI